MPVAVFVVTLAVLFVVALARDQVLVALAKATDALSAALALCGAVGGFAQLLQRCVVPLRLVTLTPLTGEVLIALARSTFDFSLVITMWMIRHIRVVTFTFTAGGDAYGQFLIEATWPHNKSNIAQAFLCCHRNVESDLLS